ncbi:Uma2 family endonuclease [Jiella avicenniae]|uniref:Uma2 family endonuclease n=1 Tax=Jiella avicenniae TaxID=2907202 RepID=A0A9X1NY92_9HYPH|nr:Uma2 family endonuclease [Jiella avicenniae]MCE7027817.1 Uma2 family endonuclease [Jiella avicenniae]
MAVLNPSPVTSEEFLEWVFEQEGRFELVDGFVYEMMAGAREGHNVVTSNIVMTIGPQAKREGCRTTSSDTAVSTGENSIRFPDVVVDCSPPDTSATKARTPTMLVEVLSPGTGEIDRTDKLEEYQRLDGTKLIMLADPDVVLVKLYRRDDDGAWHSEKYEDLSDIIDLNEIGASLALRDIYDTLEPRTRPRLTVVEKASGMVPGR